jgi:hypothetical protein
MTRSSLVTVGVCIAAIALAPIAAQAQEAPPPPLVTAPPPPPPEAPPPQPPPPPQYYQPPPPQYYQPPPQPYYVQPAYYPVRRSPSNGVGAIVAGSILLGVGAILVGTSMILWNDACAPGRGCFDPTTSYYGEAAGAAVMDTFGAIMFIAGAILLPVGIVQTVRYSKWKATQAPQRVQLSPSLSGLKLTF